MSGFGGCPLPSPWGSEPAGVCGADEVVSSLESDSSARKKPGCQKPVMPTAARITTTATTTAMTGPAVARLLAVRALWWVGHVRPLVFSRARTHGALAFRAGQWGDGQPTLRCAVVHRHRHGTTIRVRRVAMSAFVPVLRAPWALAP